MVKLARFAPALALAGLAGLATAGSSNDRSLSLKEPEMTLFLTENYPEASEPTDPVRRAVFQRINRDRAAFGIRPVDWDEAAAAASDAFCARQVVEKTSGHFLTDGVPPYARMTFAGVFGLQSENSVSWITNAGKLLDSVEHLALEGEQGMMAEKAPHDGHRRTILDPDATHVGMGYATQGGRFQMSEEFLVRKLARLSISALDARKSAVAFEGKPIGVEILEFVTIAREPQPKPLSPEQASARTSYSYPTPTLAYTPSGSRGFRVIGTENEDRLRIRSDHSFFFEFRPPGSGLYTFVFYIGAGGDRSPRPGAATTLWFD